MSESKYSTRQAAKVLGLGLATLNRMIAGRRIPVPRLIEVGTVKVRLWTEADIESVRKLLPKIANGRKTRYQKQKRKPQAKKPVPHKKKK